MFGIDDIALILGAAKYVPKAWGIISCLFGKEPPETVVEAGKLIEGVQAEIQSGRISPEQQVELKRLLLENEQVKARYEFEREKLVYEDQAGGREVVKTALTSEDPFVRRTRPKILRRLFSFVCFYSAFAPVIYIDACYLNLDAAQLGVLKSLLVWIGTGLWSAFLTGFTGYTVVRSKYDKRGLPSDLPSIAKSITGLIGRGR